MGSEQKALKPCPFCNGPAELAERWLYHCAECECIGHHYEQDEQGGYNHHFATKAEAIAAWNRRAITPDLAEARAEIGRLREALAELELANDAVAATRTHETYCAMLADGQSDSLMKLDAARSAARAALAGAQGDRPCQ